MYLTWGYKIYRFFGIIGIYLWAAILLFFSFGIFSKELWHFDYFFAMFILISMWSVHLYLLWVAKKAKFFSDFFGNCREGFIQLRVLSTAIGACEEELLKEIKRCQKHHLLKKVHIVTDHVKYTTIRLNGPIDSYRIKRCPKCGAKNHVIDGFVTTCEYCHGSLDK